jgi:tRNA dimethylallyltransferase
VINEVRRFSKLNIKKDNSTTKIIGIQEILKFLQGESSLSEVKEQISIKTRQYAKRQNTWARGQMIDWQKIEPQNLKLMLKKF